MVGTKGETKPRSQHGEDTIMTLRTYIDRAIRDGADFDAVINGCDV